MRDLDLLTLRLFVAVCEIRNIARVAEQNAMVGSAISKRLAQLEHTVGTPLLVRKRRGVVPTAAGETLLEHARAMLERSAAIARDMAGYAQGVRGHVRLRVTASVMAESLADDVGRFMHNPAHQHIEVSLEECVSPEVVRGVREGNASLGICWDAADLSELHSLPYRCDHLAIVAHASHPVAQHEQVLFADVMHYDYVGMPALSAVQQLLVRAAAVQGHLLMHRMQVSHFDAALRVVRANLGLSVMPAEVAEPFARVHGVKVVPLADAWAQRRFAICFRGPEQLSPAAQLLLEHLHRAGTDQAAVVP